MREHSFGTFVNYGPRKQLKLCIFESIKIKADFVTVKCIQWVICSVLLSRFHLSHEGNLFSLRLKSTHVDINHPCVTRLASCGKLGNAQHCCNNQFSDRTSVRKFGFTWYTRGRPYKGTCQRSFG